MDAKTYFIQRDGRLSRDGEELQRVAKACDVTVQTLYLVALGHKPASPKLACQIEHSTGGYVDRRDTLPEFPWDAPVAFRKSA